VDSESYRAFVIQLSELADDQAADVAEKLRLRRNSADVQKLASERFSEGAACPHCSSHAVAKHGKAHGTQRFRCGGCRKTFTALTGTPFHRMRNKDKLLDNALCMADGLTLEKTAARLGISVTRAFRWRHKCLEFLSRQKPAALTGTVEADETVFPVSYKGQRKPLPRESKRHGGPLKSGEGKEKVSVLVAIQRGTRRAYDHVLKDGTTEALTDALRPALGTEAFLVTDGNATYWKVAAELKVKHDYFVSGYHGKGGVGELHVQSVNRYDSTLKTWISRFRGVATRYLPNYLGWRRLLDRFEDALTPQQFMYHALRERYLTPGFQA
jgi:transposase-like protein